MPAARCFEYVCVSAAVNVDSHSATGKSIVNSHSLANTKIDHTRVDPTARTDRRGAVTEIEDNQTSRVPSIDRSLRGAE